MARYIEPASYNPDSTGAPLVNGKLFFFKSGTNTQLATFKDEDLSIPNTHPILIPANGTTPNIFFIGSAKVVKTADDLITNEIGKQISSIDPVGGEKELGDFTLWDTTVTYDLNDIAEGSTGEFYISLSNANQANDPTTNEDKWELFKLLGVWNTNITYSIGDVVLSTLGNLWKSLTATAANDPETDDGTNWSVAINGQWVNKSLAFTVFAGKKYQIDASGGAVDAPLKTAYVIGDEIIVHNESISTNTVRLTNTALTIKGPDGTVTSSDNLVLDPGATAHLVAKTTTILEAV